MATKTIFETVCDNKNRHGKELPPAQTVDVRVAGKKVRRDLCAGCTAELRDLLGIGSSRRATAKVAATNGKATRPARDPFGPTIRAWAKESGRFPDLPERGRIPAEVRTAWEAESGQFVPAA